MSRLGKFMNRAAFTFADWSFSVPNAAGEVVNSDTALNLSVVYACINVKANALAKLPLQVYQKTDKGSTRVPNHTIAYLLETRPNPYMTPFVFKHTTEVHRNLHGVAYWRIQFAQNGKPESLWLLHPPSITVVEDTKGQKFYVEATAGQENVYNEDEIIRLPYLTSDGYNPKPPIMVAKETIGTLKKQEKFLGSFYSNGTLTRGVLKVPTQLNKESKDKVREAWHAANSGESNSSKIAVLDAGIEFQNITIPLEQAQFIESQKFGIEEIARIFGVPLHLINSLDRSTFNNIEQQSMDFVINCLSPNAVAWEEELTYKLFTTQEQKKGLYVKYNMTSALRGDSQARANYYKTMLEAGVYSINEVRELEEKDRIDGGDKHLVSLNFTTIENLETYQAAKSGQAPV